MYLKKIFQLILFFIGGSLCADVRTITADCAVLDDKLRTLQFNGHVTSKNNDLFFTADTAEVKYGNKFNSLDSAHLRGNICVKFHDSKITSEHADFNGSTLKFSVEAFHFDQRKFCLFINKDLRMIAREFTAIMSQKHVTKIIAKGHVYILHNNSIIKADSAEFDRDENSIIFHGNVAILDSKKNCVKCNFCKINLREKKYYISGRIRGDITL